jgi:DNA-binding transcriptional regulator YiaG
METRNSPTADEVKRLRENLCSQLNLGITLGQDKCAELLFTSRRAWQQWERGERGMHPAFWRLINIELELLYKSKSSTI